MSKEQTLNVKAVDDDIRLDRWFKRHYPNIPQIEIQKACRKGLIRIDGVKAKPADHVRTGNAIAVKFLDLSANKKSAPKPKAALSDSVIRETQSWVLHKSANVIAINKPAGLAVQGGSKLKDHLDARMSALQFDAEGQPKLVHRLDKDTSGVLLLGRSAKAATNLSLAFASKRMTKIYWALVMGVPEIRAGEIAGALVKGGEDYEKMEVVEEDEVEEKDAKEAVTAYRVIEALGKRLAVVELQPITGRTHQLRVHMAQMGHPIVGDGKYGGRDAFIDGLDVSQQLHLHARRVQIRSMMGESIDVTAPLPKHMQKTFKELGIQL